jgi:rhodanese-related sulfurtransferase
MWAWQTPSEVPDLDFHMSEMIEEELASERAAWRKALKRDSSGQPYVSVEFVAQRGRAVRLIDVRSKQELLGPFGHIPAVTHMPLKELTSVPDVLESDTCVVLISNEGTRAALGARLLESLGMPYVAALEGGMRAWKQLGFCARRDEQTYRAVLNKIPRGLTRDGQLLASHTDEALSASDVEAHLGSPTSIRWVKLATFLLHGKRSCVDGRDEAGVIGTPGGDAGEFVLALASIERVRGALLTAEEVHRLLERYLDVFGRFYMHTDTHATEHLIESLNADEQLATSMTSVKNLEAWHQWLDNPPLEQREALLTHLCAVPHMGCGHLKFVMSDEEHYSVRPELTEHFLRAFHHLRWAGAPEIEWVMLGGDHAERAVLSIVTEGELKSWTRVPLISPQVAGQQVFVNHPQVSNLFRAELASFLCFEGIVPPEKEERLLEEMCSLAGTQAGHTLNRLAKGLPLFEVRFKGNTLLGVASMGEI